MTATHLHRARRGPFAVVGASALLTFLIVGAAIPSSFASFAAEASTNENALTAGTLTVTVNGQRTAPALVTVNRAVPVMAQRDYTLTVRNTGTVAAGIVISSENVGGSTARSLDDVLLLVVKNAGGTVVYSGKVSELSFDAGSFAGDASRTYDLELTWPGNASSMDNLYQGADLSFDISAAATSLSGQ